MNNKGIAVIGAGSWGTALAMLLAHNEQSVTLWDHDPALLTLLQTKRCNVRYLPEITLPLNLKIGSSLSEVVAEARDLLIVVPSHAFSSILLKIKPLLQPGNRIVWATKGLANDRTAFLHQVFEREVDKTVYPYAVLSGPSFAIEVAQGLPTAVVIASENQSFADDLKRFFQNSSFGVELSTDILGVQLGAVFKNVLAVAVGLSDGVQFGANARAALMTQGLKQLVQLGLAIGAEVQTLMGLSGCGDIILSCTDNKSRNRRFGLALAEGLTQEQAVARMGQVVEALYNVEQLRDLAVQYGVRLSVVEQVLAVIQQQTSPSEAIKTLLKGSVSH